MTSPGQNKGGQLLCRDFVIRTPVFVRRDAQGKNVLVRPAFVLDQDEMRGFAAAPVHEWSLRESRRSTPHLFTPDGLKDVDGFPLDDLARVMYRKLAPPQFWDEARRRAIPLEDNRQRVLQRWWRKRLGKNRSLDLAKELLAARGGFTRLRRAFGGWVRRGVTFDAEAEARKRSESGNAIGFAAAEEWRRLERALVRLVGFDRAYIWKPFGLFAMQFAECTPYGEQFFSRLAAALRHKGRDARRNLVDGERWELCLRTWRCYADNAEPNWTYRQFRRVLVKVILNYEFMKRGRRDISPESVRKWLMRNGW